MINKLLNITSSDRTLQMAIIAIGGLGIGIFLVRFAIRKMGENKFRKLGEECARIPRFWEGFNLGSPTARHLN